MGVVEAKLAVKDDAKSSSSPPPPPPNFSMDVAHGGLASLMSEETKPLDVVGDPEIPAPADDGGFDEDPESPKKGGEEWVAAAAAAAEKGVWPRFPQRPDATECAYYMKTGTCKYGLNCRFNHPPKRRHRANPEKQLEDVKTIKAAHKGSGSEKMGQTTCKVGEKEKKVPQKSFTPENAEKKKTGTVLKKVEQTEKKVGEKEKKVAQKNFKPDVSFPTTNNVSSPKDADKKQKGTVLKKVEQTEKKAVEKEEQTPKKMDLEKVALKKQWKVVQKATREEHEESSSIMEVQTSCRVDEKEKEIANSFMQLKCEETEEKQKAILIRTVEQIEKKAAEDKQFFPERIEHEDKKVDILSLLEDKQTLSGRTEQQDYKAAGEKGKETTSEKGQRTELKAAAEEGKETTLGKGGLIEHKAAMEKGKETTLEKGGQIECKFYTMPGGCKYGKSCKYVHSQKKMEVSSLKLNFLGLPIRPGAKECPYYMRTGNCKFSTYCRYHHPDPTVAMDGQNPLSGCRSSGYMQQSAFGASTMPGTPSHSQGTLNGATSFVVASPSCSPASNLHLQGFHSNSGCNGYQVHLDEYPERPGQLECHFYMKNGFCPFKSACKFDHPKSHLPTQSNGVFIPSCPPQQE